MKLYLSSFDIGNQPEQLIALVGFGKSAVIVFNALDHRPESREKWLSSQTKALKELGFVVEELDLRKYFDKQEELKRLLKEKDLVWVNGGNTFVLRRAMRQSGFDNIIKKLIRTDAITYGGFSAGVVILSKDLHGLDITDNPNVVPVGYDKEIIWDGLDIIDFSVAVHYQSDHPESHLTDKEIEYYKTNNIPYKTLRDGEAIIIRDHKLAKLD